MSEALAREPVALPRSAAWRRWQMLSFDEPAEAETPEPAALEPEPEPAPDPEELLREWRATAERAGHAAGHQAGQEQGQREGYAAGHAQGLAAGRAEGHAEGWRKAAKTPASRPNACTRWRRPAPPRSRAWKTTWARAC